MRQPSGDNDVVQRSQPINTTFNGDFCFAFQYRDRFIARMRVTIEAGFRAKTHNPGCQIARRIKVAYKRLKNYSRL